MRRDPYRVLGVSPGASAEELHDAYREMVKLHHPDRNGGSAESTRRFQEIQEAYDEVRGKTGARRSRSRPSQTGWRRSSTNSAKPSRPASAHAGRHAMPPATASGEPAPVEGEDSFGKILGDIRDELAGKISDARRHPAVQRVADLIDGVDRR